MEQSKTKWEWLKSQIPAMSHEIGIDIKNYLTGGIDTVGAVEYTIMKSLEAYISIHQSEESIETIKNN